VHHYFEAITNTRGDSLVGYFARVIDPVTLAVVPIYADNSATAIGTISGVSNMGKTDDRGNLSFYVEPGTYHLDIYNTDATTFIYRVDRVAMAGDVTEAAEAARIAAEAAASSAEEDAAQTAADRVQTGLDVIAADEAADTATEQAGAAAQAAVTAHAYPNSAASNVPRGLTQAGVGAITAGSGGTNGTFALGWSGGNFTYNPVGTFTVAGGALTAVTITDPGLYIGASPTVPTPTFAASSGLTGATFARTAQFLETSGGYWVQSTDNTALERYVNSSGTATAQATVGALPTTTAVTNAITAANAAAVANYTQAMKSAVGTGTLSALFDMDGPRTAYSGSPTILTAMTSLEGNAYSLGLYGTIYSGADPRPYYSSRGIYMSSGAGLQTTSQMLSDTSNDFAFFYAVDLNTLTGTVSLQASLPGGATDGDLYLVNADRNVTAGLGNDIPIVLDTNEIPAANLVNGYFRWNNYNTVWNSEAYLFKATGPGGQRFEVRINHLGQLTFFAYDGTNFGSVMSKGVVVATQGTVIIGARKKGNVFYLVVNGKNVFGVAATTVPNVNALNQWYFNGQDRQAAVAQPVINGIRHYWKGMAIANSVPDDAAFIALHDTFAARHGGKRFAPPRAARGVLVIGQSWTQGAVAVSDTWRHGPNLWDGQVAPNNVTYHQESDSITRETFSNVFASRDLDNPSDIAPYEVDVNNFGAQQNANSHNGGGTGENFIKGWAKQLNDHATGRLSDWFIAMEGIGGASIATLSFQSVTPLVTQLKTITLASNDYYNKMLRQVVYQRDFARAKGQTYSVDLILWQQGHTDLSNSSYQTTFLAFYDRIVTDVQAITGQSNKPVLLMPQIGWSYDGNENSGNCASAAGTALSGVIDQTFLDIEDNRSTRPMYCIGPVYQVTNFIHPYRCGHRWVGEIYGLATTRILFDGESYGCCRPYAYTYSLGGTTIDIDYRVRSGRSLVVNATNSNNVYTTVSNSGFEFTDASGGGVTISGVSATSATRIRITLSGAIGTGDTIRYTGKTHRVGNVADGAAVNGQYKDQDWTVSFTANEPKFTLGNFNDLRQWAAASTKVLT